MLHILPDGLNGLQHVFGEVDHVGERSGWRGRGRSRRCRGCGAVGSRTSSCSCCCRGILLLAEEGADHVGHDLEERDDSEADDDRHQHVVVLQSVGTVAAKLKSGVDSGKLNGIVKYWLVLQKDYKSDLFKLQTCKKDATAKGQLQKFDR